MRREEQSEKKIDPGSALYIKLGSGGKHERECIEVSHTLWLGYQNVPHQLCLDGEWAAARAMFVEKEGSDSGAATRYIKDIHEFCAVAEEPSKPNLGG